MIDEAVSLIVNKSLRPAPFNIYLISISLDKGKGVSVQTLSTVSGMKKPLITTSIRALQKQKLVRIFRNRVFVDRKSVIRVSDKILDNIINKLEA